MKEIKIVLISVILLFLSFFILYFFMFNFDSGKVLSNNTGDLKNNEFNNKDEKNKNQEYNKKDKDKTADNSELENNIETGNNKKSLSNLNSGTNKTLNIGTEYFDFKQFDIEYDLLGGDKIRREQAAYFLVKYSKDVLGKNIPSDNNCSFKDLNKADKKYRDFIISSCRLGIFKGVRNKFYPKGNLVRDDLITVILRLVNKGNSEIIDSGFGKTSIKKIDNIYLGNTLEKKEKNIIKNLVTSKKMLLFDIGYKKNKGILNMFEYIEEDDSIVSGYILYEE